MKKKFIVIFGLVCLAISLFFVFKNDNVQVVHDKNIASVSNNTASVTDSTAPKTKTMYRILEFNGDTTVWDSTDCVIRDSSFSCKKEIIQDLSDIVNKKFINKIHEDFSSIYKDMSILDEALENHKKKQNRKYITIITHKRKFNQHTQQQYKATKSHLQRLKFR